MIFDLDKKVPDILYKRNLERNGRMSINGFRNIWCNQSTPEERQEKYRKRMKWLRFKYKVLKRIEIPHIEFVLTTRCTLRCRDCMNYIPLIKQHKTMSLDDFECDLKNILKVTDKIHSLLLLGGEPLIVKDFDKYVEFAAKQKKIKNIYIFSNGTIIPNEKLINVMKKYNNKVTFWLSNYSANEDLKSIIKDDTIKELLNKNNVNVHFEKDLCWAPTQSPQRNFRTQDDNKEYYRRCLHPCVSIIDGKIFPCPRACAYYNEKMFEDSISDYGYIDVRDKDFSTKKLIEWYSKDYYEICDICNINEDLCKPQITPAIQLEKVFLKDDINKNI